MSSGGTKEDGVAPPTASTTGPQPPCASRRRSRRSSSNGAQGGPPVRVHIYWPTDGVPPLKGWVIGWCTSKGLPHWDICVAGVIADDGSDGGGGNAHQDLEKALMSFGNDPRMKHLLEYCHPDHSPPVILGTISPDGSVGGPPSSSRSPLWLILGHDPRSMGCQIVLHGLYIQHTRIDDNCLPAFFLYQRPDQHQGHFFRLDAPETMASTALEYLVHQMNGAHMAHDALLQRLGTSSSSSTTHHTTSPLSHIGGSGHALMAMIMRLWTILTVFTNKVAMGLTLAPNWQGLWKVSLLCRHVAWRCQLILGLLEDFTKVHYKLKSFVMPVEAIADDLLSLKARMIQVLVDMGLGLVLWYLCHTSDMPRLLAMSTHSWWTHFFRMDVLRANIEWLNHHPGGFKLNVPLTKRLGAVALTVLDLHDLIVEGSRPWLGPALTQLGATLALTMGMSSVMALLFDLSRLVTAHLTLLYVTFTRLYYLDLSLLSCLWRLFRAKKRNILRHRVDTCEYRTPQLLLGVLLFAIFACLFPTVAAFYILFAIAQALALMGHTALWLTYLLLCGFPLFAFVHRSLVPMAYPSSLRLMLPSPYRVQSPAVIMKVGTTCQPWWHIFKVYQAPFHRLAKRWSWSSFLHTLLSGTLVDRPNTSGTLWVLEHEGWGQLLLDAIIEPSQIQVDHLQNGYLHVAYGQRRELPLVASLTDPVEGIGVSLPTVWRALLLVILLPITTITLAYFWYSIVSTTLLINLPSLIEAIVTKV